MGWTTCSALSLSDTGNQKARAGETGACKEASCPVQWQFSNFIGWHLLYCRRHDPHPHRFRVMLINVHGANYHPNTPWTAPAFLRQLRLAALQATPQTNAVLLRSLYTPGNQCSSERDARAWLLSCTANSQWDFPIRANHGVSGGGRIWEHQCETCGRLPT